MSANLPTVQTSVHQLPPNTTPSATFSIPTLGPRVPFRTTHSGTAGALPAGSRGGCRERDETIVDSSEPAAPAAITGPEPAADGRGERFFEVQQG